MDLNVWQRLLEELEGTLAPEEFRRWFSATAYASDSGDQITAWVPSEGIRRHIETHYHDSLRRALARLGRQGTAVRLVVAGFEDDDDGVE
jgi:chromosomal replication initiation ATPase DnaA